MAAVGLSLGFALTLVALHSEPAQDAKRECDLSKVQETEYCYSCDRIDPEFDKEGYCRACGSPPAWAAVCVKEYYQCGKCAFRQTRDLLCHKGAVNQLVVLKAKTIYRCEKCGIGGDYEGPCENEECRRIGSWIRLTCASSGTWPHGGKAPRRRVKTE